MKLTQSERMELQQQASSRSVRADAARHARLILLLADGLTWAAIRSKLDCSDSYIHRWSKRFESNRLAGLFARHAGRERYKMTDRLEARILARTTKHKPADGSTHWSSRKLAAELGGDISHMTVARIWAKHGIKPHLLEGYLTSNDPDFETKAADVIGLYLNPPQNAVVFSVDEKTAIQALDRLDPVLPLSPGRAERHGFEYFRHGTLSLYAAFNTKTGEVLGKTATHTPRPSSWRFSPTSWPTSPSAKRFTSSLTTSRPTKPSMLPSSWPRTAMFICTSPRRTRLGSTRWSCGLPKSSATSSPAASSHRCLT
nr:putative transposase [uncultured bacterium]